MLINVWATFSPKPAASLGFRIPCSFLVSDHSHGTYTNRDYYDPAYNKIVCLWYGDVLDSAFRGRQIEKIGSQCDLPTTVLTQLKFNTSRYIWGKNLLNTCSPDYAYYSFEVGFGWVRPWGVLHSGYPNERTFHAGLRFNHRTFKGRTRNRRKIIPSTTVSGLSGSLTSLTGNHNP